MWSGLGPMFPAPPGPPGPIGPNGSKRAKPGLGLNGNKLPGPRPSGSRSPRPTSGKPKGRGSNPCGINDLKNNQIISVREMEHSYIFYPGRLGSPIRKGSAD